jgi:hypothetical protein
MIPIWITLKPGHKRKYLIVEQTTPLIMLKHSALEAFNIIKSSFVLSAQQLDSNAL